MSSKNPTESMNSLTRAGIEKTPPETKLAVPGYSVVNAAVYQVTQTRQIKSQLGCIFRIPRLGITFHAGMVALRIQNSTRIPEMSVHIITAISRIQFTEKAKAYSIETDSEAERYITSHSGLRRDEQHYHRASGLAFRE